MRHTPLYTASQQQVLIAAKLSADSEGWTTLKAMSEFGGSYFCSFKLDWTQAIEDLVQAGDLCAYRERMNVRAGLDVDDIIGRHPRYKYWYNDWYRLADKSRLHSELCRYAYGIDLCQTGMMTKKQLDYLCSLPDVQGTGLDVGCGSGRIAAYLRANGATEVVGIDTIYWAIRLARERHRGVNGLDFRLCDMRSYVESATERYDFMVSMDSLYFVGTQFGGFLDACLNRLSKRGRLHIFYSAWNGKDEKTGVEDNNLGHHLINSGTAFSYVDFTTDDYEHWKRKRRFLEENSVGFAMEGRELLWKKRLDEATHFERQIIDETMKRYLYSIDANGMGFPVDGPRRRRSRAGESEYGRL